MLISILFISCQLFQSGTVPSVFITIESGNSGFVDVRVFIEGLDGNSITGAIVTAVNPVNESVLLKYSTENTCYTGSFSSAASGDYAISVNSVLFPDNHIVIVPHNIISTQPEITALADSAGANVFMGEAIDPALDIFCSAEIQENASVYTFQVKNGVELVWAVNSEDEKCVIPAGTLGSVNGLAITVTAQYVSGDPLLQENNFYSVSTLQGSALYFSTQLEQ